MQVDIAPFTKTISNMRADQDESLQSKTEWQYIFEASQEFRVNKSNGRVLPHEE